MATVEQQPQHMQALARANRARRAAFELKSEVKAGKITVGQALWDERAGSSLAVMDLLMAQRQWGHGRAAGFLAGLGIDELKRVRSLTDRQRHVIAEALLPRVEPAGDALPVLSILADAPDGLEAREVAYRTPGEAMCGRGVSHGLQALEQRGLVERHPRPRRALWTITTQGREVVADR